MLLLVVQEERTEAITEVHVLSTLVHPNILQYEDSFLDSGALHIVMEYAAGGTLEHVIEFYKREELYIEEKMIWSILVQLLQALNYCHAIPIMHRDIKPANVLLSRPITLLKNAQVRTHARPSHYFVRRYEPNRTERGLLP